MRARGWVRRKTNIRNAIACPRAGNGNGARNGMRVGSLWREWRNVFRGERGAVSTTRLGVRVGLAVHGWGKIGRGHQVHIGKRAIVAGVNFTGLWLVGLLFII